MKCWFELKNQRWYFEIDGSFIELTEAQFKKAIYDFFAASK